MKKITLVSIISILFLSLSSIIAYVLRYGTSENKWMFFGLGIFLLIISGILALSLKKYKTINITCMLINSISLGFLIRAWYLFRGFDNPLWVMLLVSFSAAILLWIYYLLLYIPFFDRHPVLFTVIFIILSLIGYIIVMCSTTTTFVSTFGYYMIVELAFIIGLCMESKTYSGLIKNMLYCTYSILVVAIIMGLLMLAGDGADLDFDFGLDGLDFSSGNSKKARKNLEREVINDLNDRF